MLVPPISQDKEIHTSTKGRGVVDQAMFAALLKEQSGCGFAIQGFFFEREAHVLPNNRTLDGEPHFFQLPLLQFGCPRWYCCGHIGPARGQCFWGISKATPDSGPETALTYMQ